MNYTYEMIRPDETEPTMWGTFTSADLTYKGDDLGQVAAEQAKLVQPMIMDPPTEGTFKLWTTATGVRIEDTPPAYVGDIATLLAAG